MAVEQYANAAVTTLNGNITNSATSLVVTSASLFPGSGQFTIQVDSEIMLVTGVSSTTFTVTRGAEGTTAATHSSGAAVWCGLTLGSLGRLVNVNHGGTFVLGTRTLNFVDGTGLTWTVASDSGNVDITPTVSAGGGDYAPVTAPPLGGSLTWLNQGGASFTNQTNGLAITAPAGSGNNMRCLLATAPATPYSLVVKLYSIDFHGSSHVNGLCFYEASSGKLIRLGTNGDYITLDKMNSTSSYGSQYSFQLCTESSLPSWLKIHNDGTNLTFSYSPDGYYFFQLNSKSVTDWFSSGPSSVGLFSESNDSSNASAVIATSWVLG